MSARDDDIPGDAFELFMAEAARVRLSERTGDVLITLRSGTRLAGHLVAAESEAVDRHIHLVERSGRCVLVATDSVVSIVGAVTELRDESPGEVPRSLRSRLRGAWASGCRVSALLQDARWINGSIVIVAADHMELSVGDQAWVVPYSAVEAWDLTSGHRRS